MMEKDLRWVRPLLLLLSAAAQSCGSNSAERPQRVVLITLDTLRYDSFGQPGQAGEMLMPATQALAAAGLSFDNFYANTSTTQPSHASLFSGRNPWQHGVTRNGMLLDASLPNLTVELKQRGFATHAVVSSFPLHGQFGFERGFDRYDDEFDVPYVKNWEGRPVEEGRFFSLGASVTRQAVAALDEAPAGDQFFWFHYFDPHDPYGDRGAESMGVGALLGFASDCLQAGERQAEQLLAMQKMLAKARGLYEVDVQALDASLAVLYERLQQQAADFDTHILISADHGESFGELGAIGHGKRVTREQVHVPLIIHSPRVAQGVRSDAASLLDLAPTIMGLVGPKGSAFPGRDLVRDVNASELPVLGMRRSFAKPKHEVRSDGKRAALPAHWFFEVQGSELVCGNADLALWEGDPARPLDADDGKKVRALFAALTSLCLEGPQATELSGKDVEAAMRALGYTDSEE